MPNNYVLLERIELNNTASSVTFSNIPQTGYTDLKIVASTRSNRADTNDFLKLSFNGVTTNLSHKSLEGNGSTTSSGTDASYIYGRLDGNTATTSTFGNAEFYIPNYTSSSAKSVSGDTVMENNATYSVAYMLAGLWNSTAAITSATLAPYYGTAFVVGSTFSLYGIANSSTTPAIAPKADGGNVIGTDGTYWYHIFNTNGTFTPQVGLSCEYLVIAGGGAGAGATGTRAEGGGGGAGGALSGSGLSLSPTSYAVTIGAGGAGVSGAVGSNGTNTTFASFTAIGGGRGGLFNVNSGIGADGGSGGGGANNGAGTAGGAGTSGQGYAGGTGTAYGTSSSAGGGGGAGSVGANGSGNVGGAGGSGITSSITGTSVTYAAGGRGGDTTGDGNGNSPAPNLGQGGGGASTLANAIWTGGSGSSGIVVVRYTVA